MSLKGMLFQAELGLLCLFGTQSVFSKMTSSIYTLNSMNDIKKYIDKDTLILFDIDHTIFEGKEYGYEHANWFYDRIDKGKAEGVEEAQTALLHKSNLSNKADSLCKNF